jgi:hypothetical protein
MSKKGKATASRGSSDSVTTDFWTTDPTVALDIRIGSSGTAAYLPRTIVDVFQDTVTKHPDRPALALKRKGKVCVPKIWLT